MMSGASFPAASLSALAPTRDLNAARATGARRRARISSARRTPPRAFIFTLGISYPNARDAQEAFARGEIDAATRERLVRAAKDGLRPDWQTPLGGFIMLHGEHPERRAGDWTAGCVALGNADMEALFSLAGLGDSVEIYP